MKINGLPVKDADHSLVLSIRPADIRAAKSKAPDKCAAALAAMRAFGCQEALIHITKIYLRQGRKWIRFCTPAALAREIITLDRGGKFAPGDYLMKSPPAHERLGRMQGSRTNQSTGLRRSKRRGPQHITSGIRPDRRGQH